MQRDQVDTILDQWRRERPDIDPSPMGTIGRLSRIARVVNRALDATFASFELTGGEFDVLATLRRAGRPYRLTPTVLFTELMLSSGAMTNRLDRLERAGLIERMPDPADGRGILVGLTPRGEERIDTALVAHLANEKRLLDGLDATELAQLVTLLRKLLCSLEGSTETKGGSSAGQPGE